MAGSVKNLEKYIEEVHTQQITDYEKLKKIATDAALGINNGAPSPTNELSVAVDGQASKSNELHAQCSQDFVAIGREQKRINKIVS